MTAFGIGKLGAYANYFLEAYAGLAHLAALGLAAGWNTRQNGIQPPRLFPTISMGSKVVILGLCGLALVRYYPLWSEEFLMPAGVIEGKNPARGSFGRRGVWQDLQREAFVLQARGRINAALKPLLEQAQPPLLTDVPGVAAQEGMPSRAQMFEHRMLYDQGQWDQRPLLRELANGQIDLVVLDYLGNWMTPEMIHIVTKRYAQDVSVGTYSIYRPIKIGPKQTVNLSFPYGLRLESVALTPPAGRTSYAPAEIVPVTLSWRVAPGSAEQGVGQGSDDTLEVGLRLLNERGALVLENRRLLVYAALSAADWGDAVIEHMQPISLPDELPPGSYRLQVLMRQHGRRLTAAREIARLEVADSGGQLPGETGYYFVPEAFMQAWEQAGVAGLGEPEMPAVPFNDSMLQCFEYACLRLTAGGVERAPIGEMVWLADAGFPAATISSIEQDAQLLALWESLGAEQTLGPLLGRPLTHFGYVIQYTRYARLERFLEGGEAQPGNVGRDVLRLPGDLPYRWP